jgi:hypothetical protein
LKRERLQDIEDINQQIQEDNYELRRLLWVSEDEKHNLQLELQAKDEILTKLQRAERVAILIILRTMWRLKYNKDITRKYT